MLRLLWLAGPLAVRDLIAGSTGIIAGMAAFIAGCALAGTGTLVWFGYFSLLGVASLSTGITQLRRVSRLARAHVGDDDIHYQPLAA